MSNDEEKVGYAKPPKKTQFKKGQSGNPTGRRNHGPSFKSDLEAELHQTIAISENGRPTAVSTQRLIVKKLAQAALLGDIKAVNVLISCIRQFGLDDQDASTGDREKLDLDYLEDYLRRQRLGDDATKNKPVVRGSEHD